MGIFNGVHAFSLDVCTRGEFEMGEPIRAAALTVVLAILAAPAMVAPVSASQQGAKEKHFDFFGFQSGDQNHCWRWPGDNVRDHPRSQQRHKRRVRVD